MILGGEKIRQAFNDEWKAYYNGKPMTEGLLEKLIGPNSFDVTLANVILHQNPSIKELDPFERKSNLFLRDRIGSTGFTLYPGQLILGVTEQRFNTDAPLILQNAGGHDVDKVYFVQKYDGRSTMGRLGIMSHVTAGFGDYGFNDYWTLEITNVGRISTVLHSGMRIGQISFEAVYAPTVYKGAYTEVSDMPEPKAPKLGKDRF